MLGWTGCARDEESPSVQTEVDSKAQSLLRERSEWAAQNPRDASAHYNLAVVHARLGRHDDAEAGYRTALALDPNYARCYEGLGLLAFRRNQIDVAASYFRRAVDLVLCRRDSFAKSLDFRKDGIGRSRPDERVCVGVPFGRVAFDPPDEL